MTKHKWIRNHYQPVNLNMLASTSVNLLPLIGPPGGGGGGHLDI